MSFNKSTIKSNLYQLLLLIFLTVVMVDPSNKLLHLKELSFSIMIILALIFHKGRLYKDVVVCFSLLFSFAIISLCIGTLVFDTDMEGAGYYFKALSFGLVFFVISKMSIKEILRLNYYVGLIMLLAYIGGFFDLSFLIDKIYETENVKISRRDLLGMEVVMFFYRSMPFCFLSLIYAIRKKKIVESLILLAPIAYGGSRTPMLMALAIILYIFYDKRNNYYRIIMGFMAIFVLIYLLFLLTSATYSQEGDELKGGIARYLLNHSSIIGHGVGAQYWDPERRQFTSNTEVTYFEMLYQYGWLLFPFALYIFIKPILVMYKRNNDVFVKDFAVAYLLYLVNAGTNPLLISSTGMYVFACALTIAAKVKEERKKCRLCGVNVKSVTVI